MIDPENKLRYKQSKKEILEKIAVVIKVAKKEENYTVLFLCELAKEILAAAKNKVFAFVVKDVKSVTSIYTDKEKHNSEIGAELLLLTQCIDWHISAINERYTPWQVQALRSCKDMIYFYDNKILRTPLVVAYYQTVNEKMHYQEFLKKK